MIHKHSRSSHKQCKNCHLSDVYLGSGLVQEDDIFTVPGTERDIKAEVAGWFKDALAKRTPGINLYYKPLSDEFERITKKRKIGEAFIGYEYEGGLFEIRSGPGDCDIYLFYAGKLVTTRDELLLKLGEHLRLQDLQLLVSEYPLALLNAVQELRQSKKEEQRRERGV